MKERIERCGVLLKYVERTVLVFVELTPQPPKNKMVSHFTVYLLTTLATLNYAHTPLRISNKAS